MPSPGSIHEAGRLRNRRPLQIPETSSYAIEVKRPGRAGRIDPGLGNLLRDVYSAN
jgi:hypothetical protein